MATGEDELADHAAAVTEPAQHRTQPLRPPSGAKLRDLPPVARNAVLLDHFSPTSDDIMRDVLGELANFEEMDPMELLRRYRKPSNAAELRPPVLIAPVLARSIYELITGTPIAKDYVINDWVTRAQRVANDLCQRVAANIKELAPWYDPESHGPLADIINQMVMTSAMNVISNECMARGFESRKITARLLPPRKDEQAKQKAHMRKAANTIMSELYVALDMPSREAAVNDAVLCDSLTTMQGAVGKAGGLEPDAFSKLLRMAHGELTETQTRAFTKSPAMFVAAAGDALRNCERAILHAKSLELDAESIVQLYQAYLACKRRLDDYNILAEKLGMDKAVHALMRVGRPDGLTEAALRSQVNHYQLKQYKSKVAADSFGQTKRAATLRAQAMGYDSTSGSDSDGYEAQAPPPRKKVRFPSPNRREPSHSGGGQARGRAHGHHDGRDAGRHDGRDAGRYGGHDASRQGGDAGGSGHQRHINNGRGGGHSHGAAGKNFNRHPSGGRNRG